MTKDVIEWTVLVYKIKLGWAHAMNTGQAWLGDSWELVEKEDQLFSLIKLSLDENIPEEGELLAELYKFREEKDTVTWSDRRDVLLKKVRKLYRNA